MHVVLQHLGRVLVTMGPEDLDILKEALSAQRAHASSRALLERLEAEVAGARSQPELEEVWADGGAVHVRVMSVWGDPMDWGSQEARKFAERILRAASDAE